MAISLLMTDAVTQGTTPDDVDSMLSACSSSSGEPLWKLYLGLVAANTLTFHARHRMLNVLVYLLKHDQAGLAACQDPSAERVSHL